MTDSSIPTARNRGHIRAVIKPGALHTIDREDLGLYLVSIGPSGDLFGSVDGYAAALDPATGEVLWELPNAWFPDGFPDDGPVYIVNYDPPSGFNGRARGTSVHRIDPGTGRSLAVVDGGIDPLQTEFVFDPAGTTMWWEAGTPEVAGHDMALDVALGDAPSQLAWRRAPRDQVPVNGDDRSVRPGYEAIDVASGRVLTTADVPAWIGVSGDRWSVYTTADGGLSAAPKR